jgi:ribose transport system ATP-binding protein
MSLDPPNSAPLLELRDIAKSFFGVPVLQAVSLTVPAGRTLGLIGENGAGKSTLMNIVGGNLRPDGGEMRLAGAPYRPRHPRDATAAGVGFIHQELNLFANLSIAENIFLNAFPRLKFGPMLDRRALRARTHTLLEELGLRVSPDTLVERLSPGERQLVEIAKALATDVRVIIFDEPTTSLSARETEHLFGLMQRWRARGLAMIYISHLLNDVLRLCDDIVVLRDGEEVGRGPRGAFTIDRMITLMVGRNVSQVFPTRTRPPRPEIVLEARGVSHPGLVEGVSFALRRGEVLGLSGLMGAGRSELARLLFGAEPCARGQVLLDGRPLQARSPRRSIQRGLAFLTEDRREEGLCLEASIADNMALVSLPALRRWGTGWIRQGQLRAAVARLRREVRLTETARDVQPVKTLSGGNQQKVVLAKWLLAEPRVFILDEPTRGIDVGAKVEVYRLINELADRGAGLLLISSELEELIGLCDRILVLRQGEIVDELCRGQFDPERILRSALGTGAAA